MLRRAASSSLGGRGSWLLGLPRRQVMSAATSIQRHQEVFPRLRPLPPLPRLGDAGARGYRRMARRIPLARPEGYSTSDGEADAHGEEDLELGGGEDSEEGGAEWKEWEGYELSWGSGSDEDEDEDASKEGEKN